MAELKKCVIKKAIRSIEKSYDYHSYNGKYDVLVDLDELVDLIVSITTPTTTEAEIRASAIDEFADKLKESLMKNYRHFVTTDTDGFDWITTDAVGTHIDEIAEQLKESE